ncbi:hypothetical protein X975_01670, partial [Stegodyphus mimosarum]
MSNYLLRKKATILYLKCNIFSTICSNRLLRSEMVFAERNIRIGQT